jgi:hypothetical protein
MTLRDRLLDALGRRRPDPSARLTPEERAALQLAGYDDIRKRAATGPADVVSPGRVDSAQGWSIHQD